MNCNCKDRIAEKLLERFRNEATNATQHGVQIEGYMMAFSNTGLDYRSSSLVKKSALYPLKNGGHKVRNTTINLTHSFCPFCGVAAAPAKGAAA